MNDPECKRCGARGYGRCPCQVRLGPRSDGFYTDAERDAFQEKQRAAVTAALESAMKRMKPLSQEGLGL